MCNSDSDLSWIFACLVRVVRTETLYPGCESRNPQLAGRHAEVFEQLRLESAAWMQHASPNVRNSQNPKPSARFKG